MAAFFSHRTAITAGQHSRRQNCTAASSQKFHSGRSSGGSVSPYSTAPSATPVSIYSRSSPSPMRRVNHSRKSPSMVIYRPSARPVRRRSRRRRSRTARSRS
ncbi:MAG: hypothetical protein UDO37_03035 [Oscillospiraceae bacterium]|nr:hypothetical protein [Oscillospiraceae bacterium]